MHEVGNSGSQDGTLDFARQCCTINSKAMGSLDLHKSFVTLMSVFVYLFYIWSDGEMIALFKPFDHPFSITSSSHIFIQNVIYCTYLLLISTVLLSYCLNYHHYLHDYIRHMYQFPFYILIVNCPTLSFTYFFLQSRSSPLYTECI